jgi:pilus assembly protein FimV
MAVQRDKVIASAEKLVAKGKIEPAIKEYERLLEDNPNDVNTLNRIGDLWVRINRNDEAVKVFTKIADHYSRDGFFLKAIAIYKKINKLDPSKLDVYARLADLYAKQGLAMEAKSQYQVLADYYLKHGDPTNALGIYRKISELDPNSINVHVKLADLYVQVNKTADALKEYDRVGRMLLKRGMLDEAVQVFRKALKIDPKNTELVDSLVTALLEAKDFDNARQIVETALEGNRENPKLLAMLGRIQLGRGDSTAALATLERATSADPNEPTVRETLADLYLKQSDAGRALDMMVPLVERALSRGERHAAIEMLTRILRVDARHIATLERLVAVYQRLNEETNVLASMNSLAEAHVARGTFADAAKVLENLIQREPQNAQHRNKLQFVRTQMGEALPPRMPTPPPMPALELPPMEVEETAPTFDLGGLADSDLSLDLDDAPAIELDFEIEEPAPAPEPPAIAAPPPPPPQRLEPAVELAAADIAESSDDLDFVTEHLTEAEVFAKYGLAEKAAEHLRAVLERAPKNLTAHERLFRILLEEGDVEGARAAAGSYLSLLNDPSTAAAVRNEFLTRGHTFDAEAPRPAPRPVETRPQPVPEPEPMPAPEPEPAFEPEPALHLESGPEAGASFDFGAAVEEITFDVSAADAAFELESDEEEPVESQPEAAPEQEPELLLDLETEPMEAATEVALDLALPDEEVEPEPLVEVEPEPEPVLELEPQRALELEPEPALELEPEPALELEPEPALELEPEPALELEPEPALELEPEPLLELEPDTVEELAPEPILEPEPEPVVESVIEMELEETIPELTPETSAPFFGVEGAAERAVDELPADELPVDELAEIDFYIEQELFDEARRKLEPLEARFAGDADLAARRERIEAAAPATTDRPAVLSRDEIESELLSAIPDDDEELAAEATPSTRDAAAMSAAVVQEENLFADEDNFFDLAAELESELADEEEAISLSEEEQSLEEIFKEFKRGVEQQLDSEDYDTHYNLGIAYKEMGLVDEAIGEFQLASKDPKRAVECASMLGLCFLEKGMPQLAIKWYRKGLEMPEISEDEHVGLLYDLASAYQEVGDTENAQKSFMEVYAANSNYRDIVSRIKQLEDSRR